MFINSLGKKIGIVVFFGLLTVFLGHIQFELPGKLGVTSNFAEVALIMSLPYISKWPMALFLPLFTFFNATSIENALPSVLCHVIGFSFLYFVYKSIKKINHNVLYIITWIVTITLYYFLILLPVFVGFHYFTGTVDLISAFFEYSGTAKGVIFEWIMTSVIAILFHLMIREVFISRITKVQLQENIEHLKKVAFMDTNTGLYNGLQLEKDLQNMTDKKIAFIGVRFEGSYHLNHEKGINVTMGIFSEIILHLYKRLDLIYKKRPEFKPPAPLKNCYRINETVFIFVVDLSKDFLEAKRYLNNKFLREFFKKEFELFDAGSKIDFQGGLILYPYDVNLIEDVSIHMLNMLHAKRNLNIGYFVTFDTSKHIQHIKEEKVKQLIPDALKNNEFRTVFQPKIDLKNNRLYGYEALARWESSELGTVSPLDFIPIAEQYHFIETITNNQLKDIYRFVRAVINAGYRNFRVSVNISPRLLTTDFLDNLIYDIDYHLLYHYIELEITESTFTSLNSSILKRIQKLKEIGITIAIDDFGTGYSNLVNLQDFEPEVIKIDKSFIDNIPFSDKSNHLVLAILDMAKNLNMKVVAEGIESVEQKNFLEQNGCNIIQGYYYSKPLEFENAVVYSSKSDF